MTNPQDKRAKITPRIVSIIRRDYATGDWTYRALAKRHGISHSQIANIVNRDNWKGIE